MTRQKTLFPEPEPEPDFPQPRDDDPSTWLITMDDDEHGATPWRRINETDIVDSNGFAVAKCSTVPNALLIEMVPGFFDFIEHWSERNPCDCDQTGCWNCRAANLVNHVKGEPNG